MKRRSFIQNGVRRKRSGGATTNTCCPSCRKIYKSPHSTCPQCKGIMVELGYRFRPPTKTDEKGWKKVEEFRKRKFDRDEKTARWYILESVKVEEK